MPETGSKKELETSDTRAATAPKGGVTQQRPQQQSKYSGWCCFLLRPPPKSLQRRMGRNNEKSSARPGTTASKILETNNTRHETKAQQQKSTLALLLPLPPSGAGPKKAHWVVCLFWLWPRRKVAASNGASPSPAFRRGRSNKKKHPGWCFFALAPCRRPTGLFLPRGRSKKKITLGGVFFFALAPPKCLGAQRGATKQNTLHTRGRQQKNILEANDTGHEQKVATTKKTTPWPA